MSADVIKMPVKAKSELPDHPAELMNLPGNLGMLQDYIHGRMSYPCRATAGFYSLIVVTMLLQTNNTIKSRDGLGFNEYYLGLAPTGFGKEEIRRIVSQAYKEIQLIYNPYGRVKLHFGAPASKQGIHELLQVDSRSIFFMADEFAGWLKSSAADSHKNAALDYLMECYTKAIGSVHPGNARTVDYVAVNNPRVSVVATSTGSAMFETLTRSQAESGAYNRWVIFVGPEKLPEKRYTGMVYEMSEELVNWIELLAEMGDTENREGEGIGFSVPGFEKFIELDKKLAEPIKAKDGIIGGRLAEQAIKMAGVIAIANGHKHIGPEDMEQAFKIRIGLYHRASAAIASHANLDNEAPTTKAVEQLVKALATHKRLYLSQLPSQSRAYKALGVRDQEAVQRALVRDGHAEMDGKKLVGLFRQ